MSRQSYAPALVRGLDVLERLAACQFASLEALAQETGIAKSSLLRLLDTLVSLGHVQRDPHSKLYRACTRLVLIDEHPLHFSEAIRIELEQLSKVFEQATEWWEPAAHGMILRQRIAPERELMVRARIGSNFAREKLESIPLIGRACFDLHPDKGVKPFSWDENGAIIIPAAQEAQARLHAAKSGFVVDDRPNAIGVRRIAQLVRHQKKAVGVVAIAVPLRPWIPDLHEAFAAELNAAVQRLNEFTA